MGCENQVDDMPQPMEVDELDSERERREGVSVETGVCQMQSSHAKGGQLVTMNGGLRNGSNYTEDSGSHSELKGTPFISNFASLTIRNEGKDELEQYFNGKNDRNRICDVNHKLNGDGSNSGSIYNSKVDHMLNSSDKSTSRNIYIGEENHKSKSDKNLIRNLELTRTGEDNMKGKCELVCNEDTELTNLLGKDVPNLEDATQKSHSGCCKLMEPCMIPSHKASMDQSENQTKHERNQSKNIRATENMNNLGKYNDTQDNLLKISSDKRTDNFPEAITLENNYPSEKISEMKNYCEYKGGKHNNEKVMNGERKAPFDYKTNDMSKGKRKEKDESRCKVSDDSRSDDEFYDCRTSFNEEETHYLQSEKNETRALQSEKAGAHNLQLKKIEAPEDETHHLQSKKIETHDKVPKKMSPRASFIYTRFSWKSYIKCHTQLSDWESDSKDRFELLLARYGLENHEKKVQYPDLGLHDDHDDQSIEIRGWNKDDFVYIGELISDTAEPECKDEGSNYDTSESEIELRYNSTITGARPKTYLKRDIGFQNRHPGNSEGNGDSENNNKVELTDITKRPNYPPYYRGEAVHTSKNTQVELSDTVMKMKMHKVAGYQNRDRASYIPFRRTYGLEEDSESDCDDFLMRDRLKFSPHILVKYLSQQRHYSSDMTTVSEIYSYYENVEKVVKHNHKVFSMNNNMVQLKPKVHLCPDYLTDEGCSHSSTCEGLHICDGYILHHCSDVNCINGHNTHTNHNRKVLRKFYMENLKPSVILDILQLSMIGLENSQELQLCLEYNFSECKNKSCKGLHMCSDYVGGLGECLRPKCNLNHDLHAENCLNVVESYGIDIRDLDKENSLLKVIQESPKLNQIVQEYGAKDTKSLSVGSILPSSTQAHQDQPTGELVGQTISTFTPNALTNASDTKVTFTGHQATSHEMQAPGSSKKKSKNPKPHQSSVRGESSAKNTNVHPPSKSKLGNLNKISDFISAACNNITESFKTDHSKSSGNGKQMRSTFGTVWSHYPQGDVEIPEICWYALKSVCKFEAHGCKRLHSKKHFHWQFKLGKDVSWINLQQHQVEHLEKHYICPSIDMSGFPLGNLTDLPNIVAALLSDEEWFANFQAMTLFNASGTATYQLRRLTTLQSSAGRTGQPSAYLWYFRDSSGDWIEYGRTYSAEEKHLAAKLTSLDIEKCYQKGDQRVKFQNAGNFFRYTINFRKMTQKNEKTGVVREVRRRPNLLPP